MKRHKDALGIQEGARNLRAMAKTLLEASEEAAREGIGAEQDAAVRMIVHQLAKLCKVDEINYGYDPVSLKDVYCLLMSECESRAKEQVVEEPEMVIAVHEPMPVAPGPMAEPLVSSLAPPEASFSEVSERSQTQLGGARTISFDII